MSILVETINHQINESIFSPQQTKEGKYRIASQCDKLKVASAIVVCTAPFFACFFPQIFCTVVCLGLGFVGYDVFNMADNLGDAARQSAQGFRPEHPESNIDMFLESTFLTRWIFKPWLALDRPPPPPSSELKWHY